MFREGTTYDPLKVRSVWDIFEGNKLFPPTNFRCKQFSALPVVRMLKEEWTVKRIRTLLRECQFDGVKIRQALEKADLMPESEDEAADDEAVSDDASGVHTPVVSSN